MSNPNLLDPALEEVLESVKPSDELEVAVRLKDPNDVPAELRVISRFGDVLTCRIRAGSVREVRSSPSIISVKYNRPLPLGYDPRADIETAYGELTLPDSYNDVYRIPREFGGEGVLIAFLDWGMAYAEKAFLDENNETRFLAIWDQGADYSSEKPNKYGYGRIFLKDEINASLKTDDPYSFLGYHPAKADPLGLGTHAAHVGDIACGSRRKIQHGYIQGIANKSRLIFVDLKADDTMGLSSLSSSIRALEALHFVSDFAGNRPLVVNISAGSHGGPHDDSPLVVRAIDNLVTMNPGRIVVMSTGNYKMNQTHTEGIVKSGREKQFNWIIHETNTSDKELEIWYPGSDIFSFGIMLPGGKEILFTQLGEKKSIVVNGIEVGKSYHRKDPLNNDHHIDIFIYKGAPVGKWKIILYGNDVIDGRYYAWIERDIDPRYQSKFELNDSVINSTIGSICTGRQSIVVGAFDPRTLERKLAEFSSRGPTRNGIDKPDICAPGVDIIAAKSTPLNAKPPTSLLVSKSGVSMAAPYVSGAVALLFSASKRMLTISEIRRILLGSADKCSEDNSCCGYGYLNIDTALGKVLDLTRHEYMTKENLISKQKDDQDINHLSKVENLHPLKIKSTAISDSKFIDKMLNNPEHSEEYNKLNKYSENENIYYTNYVTAARAESEIIKIVDDFIALSQGNIPHSVLLNHVLSATGAFNNNFTPEMIYNIFIFPQYRYSRTRYHDIFEVVASPGTKILGQLKSGDILIRNMGANYCHLALIVSPEVMTFGDTVRNNFTTERSNQQEGYVHVVEGKPRHRVIDRFARIICDNYGVVPDNQIVVRIRFRGTSDPSIDLSDNSSTQYLDVPLSSSFYLVETTPSSPLHSRLNYDILARRLHDAISGPGTNEIKIYLALQRLERDSTAIANLEKEYLRKYNRSLENAIRGDLRDSELEFALQLINKGKIGAKEEIKPPPHTEADWWQAVNRLSEAFTGVGTKEETIYAVLLPFRRNPTVIFNLNEQFYKRKYGEDLRNRISSELIGEEKNYALYLLGEQPILNNDAMSIKLAQDTLAYIKSEAVTRAKNTQLHSVSASSVFYNVLKNKYLKDYLSNPTSAEGKKAIEKVGRKMETRFNSVSRQVEVKPEGGTWRTASNSWEENSHHAWNKQELPALPQEVRDLPIFKYIKDLQSRLGTNLAAATDILVRENVTILPFLDVPFLIGDPNPGTGTFWIDVVGGGKNVSQLMHWATGVKYAAESKSALLEVFLLYELWHLEGWDVFGQDPINDMISEGQGRILGAELLKGSSGGIKSATDLITFLNNSFIETRAWIGALLRLRQSELDNWILAKQHKPASMHWGAIGSWHIWGSLTIYQMFADGLTLEEVKKSFMVKAEIEIYTLLFEADEWEKKNGSINITALQKALVQGKLNRILKVLAKGGKSSTQEKLDAKSAIDDLRKL